MIEGRRRRRKKKDMEKMRRKKEKVEWVEEGMVMEDEEDFFCWLRELGP